MSYGFTDIDDACEAQLPVEGRRAYTGIVETHPYATATAARGLRGRRRRQRISRRSARQGPHGRGVCRRAVGRPPRRAAGRSASPPAVAGLTYCFEPVPTDVEVGRDGRTSALLPGGPEDGSAGALASVYRVHPRTGKATKVSAAW